MSWKEKGCLDDTALQASAIQDEDTDDLESLFLEQSEPDEETVLTLYQHNSQSSDSSSDESCVYKAEPNPAQPTLSMKAIPSPSIPIQLLVSKYASPMEVIAYMDIGAQKTVVNPKVLPSEAWVPHTEYFKAANDQVFQTH